MIGMYGPVVFGTTSAGVCTFDQLKKNVQARWGVHEVFADKPMLEYIGPQLIELTFEMDLIHPVTVNPTATIVLLQETMDLAIPYPLVIGNIPMGRDASLFIMESLEVNPNYFFRGGSIIGARVQVTLKEYPTNFISSLLKALGGAFTGQGAGQGGSAIPTDVAAPSPPAAVSTEAEARAPVVLGGGDEGYSSSYAAYGRSLAS